MKNEKIRDVQILGGIIAANATAGVLMFLVCVVSILTKDPQAGYGNTRGSIITGDFAASVFVLIPIVMGALMAYCWRDVQFTRWAFVGYNALTLAILYLQVTLFWREGVICIVMASPLVLFFLWLGFLIGKAIVRRNSKRLNVSLAPFLLCVLIADVVTTTGYDGQVVDKITVHAPPSVVWRYIIDYPAITDAPDYWLWKLGLPAPVQSTATGHTIGDQRKCIFTDKKAFDERITELTPRKELMFDITTQPDDPEVIGHFVLHRGQFLLQDNGDGTTTVIGTSWYTLNVHPAVYYDLWVQDIIRHVHLRVMEHIKTLSEEDQKVALRASK